jgi:gliding motility-associated-like protein
MAQKTVVDTATVPLWIDLMQDPNANFYTTQRAFEVYWKNRKIDKGSGFKPFKRWEYNTYELIDDKGNIPKPGQLEKIVELYIKNQYQGRPGGGIQLPGATNSGPATCLTEGNWFEIGPRKLSGNRTSQPNGLGRVNSLAFHPNDSNKIFVGTPAGGLWISNDRGKSWSSNTDTLATLGVSSIAIDPFDPDTIYLGTGDRDAGDASSLGVMRSVDGGKTWQSSSSGMGSRTVGRMQADPSNKGVVIAATNGGIYRTTDHGKTWKRSIAGNFKEVVFGTSNSNYVYAATYGPCKYYRSSDNGVTFTQITSGLPASKRRMVIGLTPHDSNFVYVLVTNSRTFEGIYLSTDKGLTFTQMSNKPNLMDYSKTGSGTGGQAWYDLDMAVDPLNKSVIYVGGVNIFKSIDSGATWKIDAHWVGGGGIQSIHADQHVLEFNSLDNRLYIGNDGGIYYTANKGKNYYDISEGIGNAQIYRLGQSQRSKDMVINGYQDNGTGLYDNGNWYTIMGGDGMDCVIDPTDDTWAYSDLYYGDVRRFKNGSYNAGIAKNGKNGITESGGWVTPFVLQEGSPKTMLIGYKNIWRSTNCQASPPKWSKISNNVAGSNSSNIVHLENSPADPKILYVARSGNKFFKTTDVNATTPTWTDLTSKLPNSSAVYWIESHHKKPNTLWISQSNKVYQSDDGGSTWANISSGLPALRVLSIVFDSSSKNQALYAGTYMGVFYRDTVTKKWIWYNKGMPTYTRVRDIEIYYSPQGRTKSHVVCATYGRGNWRSPLYDEDQKQPIAGFVVSDTLSCVGTVFTLKDTSGNLPTRWKWQVRPANITYVNGTDSCSQFAQLTFNKPGTYNIKFVAENCIGKDSVEKTAIIRVQNGPKPAQCPGVTISNSQNMGIYTVAIDTFKHVSSGTKTEGGYLDLSCTETIYLKTDTTYDLDINTGVTYLEHVKVFIDFNNNGKLDDAGEWVGGSSRGKVHNLKIPIPANAVTGTMLRLRIMSDWDTIPANPCDTLRYGQTQDYGLILELREPEPHFTVDVDSVCVGELVTVTDSSEGSITDRKWYFGKDANIDSAIGIGPHYIRYSNSGYKSIRLLVNSGTKEKRIDSVIFVKPTPNLAVSISSGILTGCEKRALELNVTDSNQVATSYTWKKYRVSVKTSSDTFYTISSAALADSGTYEVIAEYLGCKDTSGGIHVRVFPSPKAAFIVSADSQCFNNNKFDFTDFSSIKTGSYSSSWEYGDGSKSTNTHGLRQYVTDGLFKVKLTLNSNMGCLDSMLSEVRVWPSPVAGFAINQNPQCFNGHQFVLNNTSTISGGAITYSWDFGDATNSSLKSATKSYALPGNYDIELIGLSDKLCADTITTTAIVNESPLAKIEVNTLSQCFNAQSFDFTNKSTIGSGSIVNNSWDMGNTSIINTIDVGGFQYSAPGNYAVKLEVESDLGCKHDTSIAVTVGESPTADFTFNLSNPCLNEHLVSFTNNSTVGTGIITSYDWNFGDASTAQIKDPPSKKYATEGNYVVQLMVETNNGCRDTLEESVDIYASPTADFSAVNTCVGEEVVFTNLSTISNGSLVYLYTFEPSNRSTDANPTYTFTTPGTKMVQLIVSSSLKCFDTLEKSIEIFDVPTADFDYSKVGSSGSTTEIQFSNQSSADAQSFEWDFASGGLSADENPLILFKDTGSFTIQLIVENSNGCRDTTMKEVFVFPETIFHVVNSFTPNGDQMNDKFELVGLDFAQEYSLIVYSRWGEKVFESTRPAFNWDGNYKDQPVQAGIYVYVLEFRDLAGKRYRKSGELLLIR